MRVLICTDSIGGCSSAEAGAALGRAFVAARPGVQVAVVPMASGGAGLAEALASLGDDSVVVGVADVAGALASRPRRIVLDLTASRSIDGGAGLLAALGAAADAPLDEGPDAWGELSRVDLTAARRLLGGTELVAVVPSAELADLLLGLRGVTARRGFGSGTPTADLIATDAALGRLAAALGVPDAPGVGAAGGAALAVIALGGWITTGPALCAQAAGLERTASSADVLVTGCDALDFVARGGDVVGEVASIAGRVLRPCVAVAREVAVSGRELRTFGVESAHPLGGGAELSASELTQRARTVAASWTW